MIPRAFGFRVVTSSRENAGDDVRVHFNQFICGNESRLNLISKLDMQFRTHQRLHYGSYSSSVVFSHERTVIYRDL